MLPYDPASIDEWIFIGREPLKEKERESGGLYVGSPANGGMEYLIDDTTSKIKAMK